MNVNDENCLSHIKHDFVYDIDDKFRKGVKEHGSGFENKGLKNSIRNARQEVLDLVCYTHNNERKIEEVERLARLIVLHSDCVAAKRLADQILSVLEGTIKGD